jgi:hypothetical protein
MQRIAELETTLQRSAGAAGPRPAGTDDTRAVIRDTPRSSRQRRTPRMSPRSSLRSPGSEPVFAAADANLKVRLRQLGDEGEEGGARLEKGQQQQQQQQEGAERGGSGKIGTAVYCQPPASAADVVHALGVQVLPPAQVHSIIKSTAVDHISGYDVFLGSHRGTPVHVWRLTIAQSVHPLDIYRSYSRYCASHPHVCSLLGLSIESMDGAGPMEEDGAADDPSSSSSSSLPEQLEGGCHLWVVEERHGDLSLARRLEKGLLSWQHVLSIAANIGSALSYLQSLRRLAPTSAAAAADSDSHLLDSPAVASPLSPLAVAQMCVPDNCRLSSSSLAKLSLAPSLLAQLEFSLGLAPASQRVAEVNQNLLPYIHPAAMFGGGAAAEVGAAFSAAYSYGVVLLQLVTEQQAPGLLGAVQAAIQSQTLTNLVPRTPPAGDVGLEYELAQLALRCTSHQAGGGNVPSLDGDVLPQLAQLARELESLGPAAMSWEQVGRGRRGLRAVCFLWFTAGAACPLRQCAGNGQPALEPRHHPRAAAAQQPAPKGRPVCMPTGATHILLQPTPLSQSVTCLLPLLLLLRCLVQMEELMMMPLQPYGPAGVDPAARRWVRHDFKMRRKLFLEEVAKVAVEGPIHKIEVRRSRCFKDSVATFSGKVRRGMRTRAAGGYCGKGACLRGGGREGRSRVNWWGMSDCRDLTAVCLHMSCRVEAVH